MRIIGPKALPKGRDVAQHPTWVWLVSAAMVIALGFVGTAIGQMLGNVTPQATPSSAPSLRDQLWTVAGYFGFGIIGAGVLMRLLAGTAKNCGLDVTPKGLFHGVIGIVLTWPIVTCTGVLVMLTAAQFGSRPSTVAHETLKLLLEHRTDPMAWALAASAIFLAPLWEEIVYRGFIQSGMLRLVGRPWPAILITSAIFCIMHVGAASWHALPSLFVLSLGMGAAFEKSRSLGAPLAMHIIFNAGNVAIAVWGR